MDKSNTNKYTKYKAKYTKNTLGSTWLYELVLVTVDMENFRCTA